MALYARVTKQFEVPRFDEIGLHIAPLVIPPGINGKVLYDGKGYNAPGIVDGSRAIILSIPTGTYSIEIVTIPRDHVVILKPEICRSISDPTRMRVSGFIDSWE